MRRLRTALSTAGTENRVWMMTHLHTEPAVAVEIADLLAGRASRDPARRDAGPGP